MVVMIPKLQRHVLLARKCQLREHRSSILKRVLEASGLADPNQFPRFQHRPLPG